MSHLDLSSRLPSDLQISRASIATYTDGAGYIKQVASGAARFNHDLITPINRGLLIESAITNLYLRSAAFDNGSWAKVRSSVTANDATGPDNTAVADKLVESTATGSHYTSQTFSGLTDDTTYTASVYAKKGERIHLTIMIRNKGNQTSSSYFNLDTGAVGTVGSGQTSSIEDVGNGWYRCIASRDVGSGGSSPLVGFGMGEADNDNNYTGDGSSGLYLWGAQFEIGSKANDYVPTTTASLLRPADDITFVIPAEWSGAQLLHIAFNTPYERTALSPILDLQDAAGSNRLEYFYSAGQKWTMKVTVAGIVVATLESAVDSSIAGDHQAALCVGPNAFAMVMDASAVNVSDASGGTPLPFTEGYLGQNAAKTDHLNGTICEIERLNGRRPIALAQKMVA